MNTTISTPQTGAASAILDVAIVGSGFSGLGMAIRLKKAGMQNFRVFEKAHDVGGTWRDNTYPGCGCDIKSQLYCYSFEPSSEWSSVYSLQGEIYQYIQHCARKYGIYPHTQFHAEVTAAVFDAQTGLWQLTINQNQTVYARHVVAALGPFVAPSSPQFEGLDQFEGKTLHTAKWDHSVSLSGKRVGMIGTGATAIQVGPAIAKEVAHLTVFQRTPNWIVPRPDRPFREDEKAAFRANPKLIQKARRGDYWFYESTAPFLILKYDRIKAYPEKIAKRYLDKKVQDPVLRQKLTPNYPFGCKRVLVSSDWYKTVQRDNVSLETNAISRFTKTGIVTQDGQEHALDVVIFATGYQVRHTGAPFEVTGLKGVSLAEQWRDGTEAYQGISAHNFPNLYFLVGPFTGPGHTSVIAYAEAQIEYVYQAIALQQQHQCRYSMVKSDVEARFVQDMDQRSEHTVWKSGCSSWYLSPNGRNNTLYPGLNIEYKLRIMRMNPNDYVWVDAHGQTMTPSWRDHLKTGLMAIKSVLSS